LLLRDKTGKVKLFGSDNYRSSPLNFASVSTTVSANIYINF
jgi:hypothetical protein